MLSRLVVIRLRCHIFTPLRPKWMSLIWLICCYLFSFSSRKLSQIVGMHCIKVICSFSNVVIRNNRLRSNPNIFPFHWPFAQIKETQYAAGRTTSWNTRFNAIVSQLIPDVQHLCLTSCQDENVVSVQSPYNPEGVRLDCINSTNKTIWFLMSLLWKIITLISSKMRTLLCCLPFIRRSGLVRFGRTRYWCRGCILVFPVSHVCSKSN